MSRVVVVDYDIGNVFSVCQALKKVGADPILTGDHSEIQNADRLILPGVGAFASARAELDNRGLTDVLKSYADTGRPFLGICVGMQMLMSESREFGTTPGFGWIDGIVDKIPQTDAEGSPHSVPHISWATLERPTAARDWSGTVLEGLEPGKSAFYFVHSFMAYPENRDDVLAEAYYNGQAITAAVVKDNVTGLQFHPERSGPAGQKVLDRFLKT